MGDGNEEARRGVRGSGRRSRMEIFVGWLLLAATSPAVTPAQVAPAQEAPVRAVPRRGPVEIDGRLHEEAWRRAPAAGSFVQARPDEGAQPARRTRVRILYDREAIYLGARMVDDPDSVRAQLVRRDLDGAYDFVRLELDPNGDGRTGYLFQVSAAGAERDAYIHDDARVDDSFDAVWSSAVVRDSAGWSAELRIPLSQIRYDPGGPDAPWGVNVVRRRLASNSTSMLALRSRARTGRVSQFAELVGVEVDGDPRSLEVTPYGASSVLRAGAATGNPFFDGTEWDLRGGLDARWKPTSSVAVDATVNPDFGQVEVDPAVVNLSAFETFFTEKRPFFTQGARLFDFGLSGARRTLFHSRRVGRRPRRRTVEGADFVDVPGTTSILGAVKAVGRGEGGLSVGALGALAAREEGRAHFVEEGRTERFVAEPRTGYGVVRARQELRDGATTVGAVGAGLHRSLPPSGSHDRLPENEVAAGLDFEHLWGGPDGRRYALWGYVSGSGVWGSPRAMVEIQTDANHYFQRPEAKYKSVDSTATRMFGREWRVQVERRSGEHWTWAGWLNEVSPGYVVDGIGFAGRTLPRIDVGGEIAYQELEPGALTRRWSVGLNAFHNFRHAALDDPLSPKSWASAHQSGRFLLFGRATLANAWQVGFGGTWAPRTVTERETRGGPLMTRPRAMGVRTRLSTAPGGNVEATARVSAEDRGPGGSTLSGSVTMDLHPSARWEVGLGPRVEWRVDGAQYVTASDAVPRPATGGTRYVFADVERQELGLVLRLDLAFSPDASLQLFAQPLLARADFRRHKTLLKPRTFAFEVLPEGRAVRGGAGLRCRDGRTCAAEGERHFDFDGDGIPDASAPMGDFSLASLRGNAVFRWEYAPGSELFLVWQQERNRRRASPDFGETGPLGALAGGATRHVVLLKLRHRIGF